MAISQTADAYSKFTNFDLFGPGRRRSGRGLIGATQDDQFEFDHDFSLPTQTQASQLEHHLHKSQTQSQVTDVDVTLVGFAGMAVGKNKRLSKGGKKGSKKKIIDPFTRKEWYDVKAPSTFTNRQIGKTLVNRTQGTKIASEGLKGRVYEVSLGDLNETEDDYRKFRLICEDVQGTNCLTNFHGMSFTRDKLCSMVKKFQVRAIRAKMIEIMQREVSGSDLKELVNKLIPDSIAKGSSINYVTPVCSQVIVDIM